MSQPWRDDLESLSAKYLDGVATDGDVERLSSILRENEAARRVYLELAEVHSLLALDTGLWMDQPIVVSLKRREFALSRWKAACIGALAASLLFVAGAAARTWMRGADASANGTREIRNELATLLIDENCHWDSHSNLKAGDRLSKGMLELKQGFAVLRYDGGATILMKGNCRIELDSPISANLLEGEIVVRAEGESAGFVVKTPATELVDLGTEFTVKVEASGATETHVLEGSVAYRKPRETSDADSLIEAGQAIRFEDSNVSAPKAFSLEEPSFRDRLRVELDKIKESQIAVEEDFDYPIGEYAPAELSGGKGWEGAWRLPLNRDGTAVYPGNTKTMRIVEKVPSEVLLETPSIKWFRSRTLSREIDMNQNSILYMSLVVDEGDHSKVQAENAQRPTLRIVLESAPEKPREYLTLGINSVMRPIVEGIGQSFVCRQSVRDNQRMVLAVKIQTRLNGDDEVSLCVFQEDEPLPVIEPSSWDVTTRGIRSDAQFKIVSISSRGPVDRKIDSFKIGASWYSMIADELKRREAGVVK